MRAAQLQLCCGAMLHGKMRSRHLCMAGQCCVCCGQVRCAMPSLLHAWHWNSSPSSPNVGRYCSLSIDAADRQVGKSGCWQPGQCSASAHRAEHIRRYQLCAKVKHCRNSVFEHAMNAVMTTQKRSICCVRYMIQVECCNSHVSTASVAFKMLKVVA